MSCSSGFSTRTKRKRSSGSTDERSPSPKRLREDADNSADHEQEEGATTTAGGEAPVSTAAVDSTTASVTAPKPKSFFDLPTELRLHIYELYTTSILHTPPFPVTMHYDGGVPLHIPKLGHISGRVRAEALPAYLAAVPWQVGVADYRHFSHFCAWLKALGPDVRHVARFRIAEFYRCFGDAVQVSLVPGERSGCCLESWRAARCPLHAEMDAAIEKNVVGPLRTLREEGAVTAADFIWRLGKFILPP